MYNLIIVDDKKSIREGLKKFINWNELGFRIVGDFPSAPEAIAFIEAECVDVLLTDIVMPDVSGLQLINELRLINPDIKVVILSAYEKFDYAREAMRLGVFCYLTKPVNIEKIKAEFTNLKNVLEQDRIMRFQKNEIGLFAREQFFNNLVNQYYTSTATVQKKSEELGLKLYRDNYCILKVMMMDTLTSKDEIDENSYQLLKNMIILHIDEYLNRIGSAYVFSSSPTDLAVLFYPRNWDNLKYSIENLWDEISDNLNIHVYIGLSRAYINIMETHKAFQEAGKVLEYRMLKKNNPVLIYDELSEFFKGKAYITSEIERSILDNLSSLNLNSLKEFTLDLLHSALAGNSFNTSTLYEVSIELILIINKYLSSTIGSVSTLEQNDYTSVKSLLQKENYEDIKDFMSHYLEECFHLIQSNMEQSSGLITEKAKKYIKEHYSEEITLNKLSEVVYVNPVYLSRLFKAKTGENFMDYLTRIRIEHAKLLLSDLSLRIYDISELVGYKSRKHFGKVFRDMTGLTPKEYRNKITTGHA
ncbi:MAG: response regulator [Lachnospiraceae bacterium]|jgi:YesN/AraC family two-component response regulator|nr:response regulator [Lachnospiraceae bacterium]